jgi:hypothetical protein
MQETNNKLINIDNFKLKNVQIKYARRKKRQILANFVRKIILEHKIDFISKSTL